MKVVFGHVQRIRLMWLIVCYLVPRMFFHPIHMTLVAIAVSPSAASTQVVPNGGKCGMIEVCLGG